jgi:4-hydroxy-3-methylbut-2-enyl diphosphate reductase
MMQPSTQPQLVVAVALAVEGYAVSRALPGVRVIRTGMGPERAEQAAVGLFSSTDPSPLAITGFCAGLDPSLAPGDVVVASEVRGVRGTVRCPSAGLLVAALARRGIRARLGPLESVNHWVYGDERARIHADGPIAADMESAWLAAGAGAAAGRPMAVLRVVTDTPAHELARPGIVRNGLRAYRALRRAAPALADWAAACSPEPRRVLLAGPRSFCAGVERAIEVVERALELHGPPVYVRKQIVHNVHVVRRLERLGAIFVDELDEVPEGALVVFSAHGVSPAVRREGAARELQVIDATCPLVSKVHAEARRFADYGDTVVLIGHAGHEEVEGTMGEIPGSVRLVENVEDVERLEVDDPRHVAYLTQTTLAVDEAGEIVEALRRRFPALRGPSSDDICYATTNRQEAIREVAREADVVLVVGSQNSSNSKRLVEVAEREGSRAHLLDDHTQLDPAWVAGARTVGLTAGASAPESLVTEVLEALRGLGPVEGSEHPVVVESVRFTLPKEVS